MGWFTLNVFTTRLPTGKFISLWWSLDQADRRYSLDSPKICVTESLVIGWSDVLNKTKLKCILIFPITLLGSMNAHRIEWNLRIF